MEHRTEEGDPLLKLWCSIVTHPPKHWCKQCNVQTGGRTFDMDRSLLSMLGTKNGKQTGPSSAYSRTFVVRKLRVLIQLVHFIHTVFSYKHRMRIRSFIHDS